MIMIEPHDIEAAFLQARDLNEGVDPNVLADLGYETHERTVEIIAGLGGAASVEAAPETKKDPVICGDCGQPMPCQHGNGRGTFGN